MRDLDLVDSRLWPQALTQLASNPSTHAAAAAADGYTAWWLRTHARVDGAPLGTFRAPSDESFAGLLDPFEHPHADELVGTGHV